ncbi:MAG: hypothetical protein AVDCRST_MAG41-923 [uncultured Corynebacteriales bacterium]|uniref:Histidine kinase/HSP90-like ATPase domain-containing protein n=1 Tax=uncultured Mycobacteriales bacterium TaxID=581187 RepID=A0A6J4HUJ5_9ACTN|nr:MAG: hypothetical protein AVDCRST_MAG41-923 [uncultured Corynebacteriales bacterium]
MRPVIARNGAPADPSAHLLDRVVELATDGADLDLVVEVVGRGLGARHCRLEWEFGGTGRRHDWPRGGSRAPQPSTRVRIGYGGRPIGMLSARLGGMAARGGRRRGLLRDLGAVLGPVLCATALRATIAAEVRAAERTADALGELRRRSVAEQEDVRRALERDLHDGAQHHLVTLRLTAGLLDHDLNVGDLAAAWARLRRLEELIEETERGVAATAAGVLPDSLVAAGLLTALEAELATARSLRIDADPALRDRRYPAPVEVTVFYACLEAVNNARKHAAGAAVRVELRHTYRGLAFSVSDDGPGFDPTVPAAGSGLPQLAHRVAAAGGELQVRSAPGAGTTVEGFIPV